MKTLIVDDNAADRKILRYILERHGCEIIEAVDGEEGLALAKAHTPALIISDALMPKMDGFQFLRMVKRDPALQAIPFLFYSSVYTGGKEEELARSLGADAFLIKPMAPEEFWAEISSLLKGGRPAGASARSVLLEEQEEYLREYSQVVTAKIEEKLRELEKAHAAARERARRYRNLFNSIRDVIIVTDTDRIVRDANQPALKETFGYDLDEVLGRSEEIFFVERADYEAALRASAGLDATVGSRVLETLFRKKGGECFSGELCLLRRMKEEGVPAENIGMIRDISERKKAEAALLESEARRAQFQTELACAAEIQADLLPRYSLLPPGFEIVARCLPARQVGGDFYDWKEISPGVVTITLGDVMGNGMAAAILMATVRATIRALAETNRPEVALQLAERALEHDLDCSDSFVTLFHARLDVASRTLTYVDCGHGYVFLRRSDGTVEELHPRGLPLGVLSEETYQEGSITFRGGDALVLYSDGLIDARPEPELDGHTLANQLNGAASAHEMVERLLALPVLAGPPADDLTVLVVRCKE
jgi:phosphoserine phosphatase RsbU/P